MSDWRPKAPILATTLLPLAVLVALAYLLKSLALPTFRHHAGWVDFSLGFMLLAGYLIAHSFRRIRLPLISGYILAGVLAGPFGSKLLSMDMVEQLRLVDDLALSFIALSAGCELHLGALQARKKTLLYTLLFTIPFVFGLVCVFVVYGAGMFHLSSRLSFTEILVLGILLGTVAVARSPSSAIAIISECRAKGPFTETVLGVTVMMDGIIIVLFTLALSVCQLLLTANSAGSLGALLALGGEIAVSLAIGAAIGKAVGWYAGRFGHDLPLMLLLLGFAITKMAFWLGHFMEARYAVSLHLEPLMICMSAGFTIQNFSSSGKRVSESLGKCALPIFVLFFSLAGAALDFNALLECWPLALCIVGVRALGIFGASWLAGVLGGDPPLHNTSAWMAHLTQAGVSIGLASLAQRQLPDIGDLLMTVVLGIITVNQIIGPVTLKMALTRVGETR
jgi:Kef-type K+ transport system membrane component KefB